MFGLLAAAEEAWEHDQDEKNIDEEKAHHWAVIVAGSNTYGNYRH